MLGSDSNGCGSERCHEHDRIVAGIHDLVDGIRRHDSRPPARVADRPEFPAGRPAADLVRWRPRGGCREDTSVVAPEKVALDAWRSTGAPPIASANAI